MSKIYGMLALPSVNARRQSVSQPEPSRIMKQRRNQKDKGTGQVTNAIAFMKSLQRIGKRQRRHRRRQQLNGGSIDDRRSINSGDNITFMRSPWRNDEGNGEHGEQLFRQEGGSAASTAFNASLAAKVADEELERLRSATS